MLTIKKAAARTGVPEHTLRAWERRYQLFAPARTEAGYRVYDEESLARIRAMRDLVDSGVSPRDAAAEVSRRSVPGANQADPHALLLSAAATLDAAGLVDVLEPQFARPDLEVMLDDWLLPGLNRLGMAWAQGVVSTAGEHLVTNLVMTRLAAAYTATGDDQDGPPALIGALPGVEHQLGLLAFAVAARRAGVATCYLGDKVPVPAWREAASSLRPLAAVTAVPRARDAAKARNVVAALSVAPAVPVLIGGGQQQLVGPPALPLGHSVRAAAAALAERKRVA